MCYLPSSINSPWPGNISMRLSDNAFQTRIADLGQHASDRLKDDKGYQLPLWPEPARGIPNPVLRGALFAAVQGKNRAVFQREFLACRKGLQIRFTGIQLEH